MPPPRGSPPKAISKRLDSVCIINTKRFFHEMHEKHEKYSFLERDGGCESGFEGKVFGA